MPPSNTNTINNTHNNILVSRGWSRLQVLPFDIEYGALIHGLAPMDESLCVQIHRNVELKGFHLSHPSYFLTILLHRYRRHTGVCFYLRISCSEKNPNTFPPFVHDLCDLTASANKIFVLRGCGPCPLLATHPPHYQVWWEQPLQQFWGL